MNSAASETAWRLMGTPVHRGGYVFGARSPSLVVGLVGSALDRTALSELATLLSGVLPTTDPVGSASPSPEPSDDGFRAALLMLLDGLQRIQRAAGLPVYETGRILAIGHGRARVCVPTGVHNLRGASEALRWLVGLVSLRAQGRSLQAHVESLSLVLQQLAKGSPGGANVSRFVRAAFDMGIPVQELPGQVLQYGCGARARWMSGSFTDETSQIGAALASNKLLAAAALRQAGIPVPEHRLADTADAALRVASQLGYPVVVKPADRQGGVGIAAGLLTPDEVKAAFQDAQLHSKSILIEKHFEGRDYRLTVLHGEVIWTIERIAGGVTGDGECSVRDLVNRLNSDPRRGEGVHAPLKRLVLDEEALALLRRAEMDEGSVPKKGQFVRLRRTANVATGGTPVAVQGNVHPDNSMLAVRAVAALRLDLAGVDLLIPDIGRSWKETGAAICEVNAQPSLGQTTSLHLYPQILRRLVKGDGRIPIVVVLGASPASSLAADIGATLSSRGVTVGEHDRSGVRVNGAAVLDGDVDTFRGGQILMRDPSVGAAIVSVNDARVLRTGLPFDRFDVLVLAGAHVAMPGDRGKQAHEEMLRELLATILPACDGRVVTVAGSGLRVDGARQVTPAQWEREPVPPSGVADVVCAEMLAADERHKAHASA